MSMVTASHHYVPIQCYSNFANINSQFLSEYLSCGPKYSQFAIMPYFKSFKDNCNVNIHLQICLQTQYTNLVQLYKYKYKRGKYVFCEITMYFTRFRNQLFCLLKFADSIQPISRLQFPLFLDTFITGKKSLCTENRCKNCNCFLASLLECKAQISSGLGFLKYWRCFNFSSLTTDVSWLFHFLLQ